MESVQSSVFSQELVEGIQDLDQLKSNHDEAFLYIANGIEHEESGNMIQAKEAYLKGLQKLDKALEVRCDRPYCVGEKWETARKKQFKMRHTLNDVQTRLATLHTELNGYEYESPPSYEDACAENNTLTLNLGEPVLNSVSAEEIFTITSGVQVFFVTNTGVVSTPSQQLPLSIYKFSNLKTPTSPTIRQPPAWLQIGNWTFPLVPGQSPVLHSGFGAYLFPDVMAQEPGSAVGVILPSTLLPSSVNIFEHYMMELTELKVEEQVILPELMITKQPEKQIISNENEKRMSHKISGAVVTGAEYLSAGISKGAEVTGRLVQFGASKLKERLTPDTPVPVNPKLKDGMRFLRGASGAVRQVSGYAVNKLGEVTVALGKFLAPHVQKSGLHLLSATGIAKDSTESEKKLDDIMIVAAGGLQGFAAVYISLEQSARSLASCLGNETVQIVDHKYGLEASEAVNNALNSVGNLALTFHNVHSLGVKSIAKRTAADTGKAVLQQYVKKN